MNHEVARRNMVENQLRTSRVTDERVIAAMTEVPRERFVPDRLRLVAYVDEDLDLGSGRTLMEPLVFARLVQAAEIGPADVVLDIGAGAGYSAAVLARLASTVFALDTEDGGGAETLSAIGIDNVVFVTGPLEAGDAAHGPFDAIIVEGRIPFLPPALAGQIAEGGRLVAVVGTPGTVGRATLFRRVRGAISSRVLFDAAILPLQGFEARPAFVF